MKFVSTRGGEGVSLDEALVRGLAPDGGLYLPDASPSFRIGDFRDSTRIVETAHTLLQPFFEGSSLQPELAPILEETFSFAIPTTELPVAEGSLKMLELFHGPTAAFKDVGAGFLAACLGRLERGAAIPLTILVATSGDTGGAVAAAFNERPGVRVVVLYPDGRVSGRQAHQLTCWGDNVLALAVKGSFDDCQALVKQALANPRPGDRFSSANSINIGRLLPQVIYYAQAALAHFQATGRKPGFIVPTGNLGNALAAVLARRMGLPVGDVILATNANRLIPDYLQGAEWQPRISVHTLASAMDVGNPGNMERLMALLGDRAALNRQVRAIPVSDEQIERQIREDYRSFGVATCPHTATATFAYRGLDERERLESDWIVVATAHPAKFEQIVEPLIGHALPLPDALTRILSRPSRFVSIDPDMGALLETIDRTFRLDGAPAHGQ